MGTELTKPQTNAVPTDGGKTSIEHLIGNPPADFRADYWRPPAIITPAEKQAAIAEHAAAVASDAPADRKHRDKWLSMLALVVNGIGPQEARVKIGAMLELVDSFPARAWSSDALKRAAAKFKWWPSAAELTEFLQDENRRTGWRRDRLFSLAHCATEPAPDPFKRTPEEQARIDAMLAQYRETHPWLFRVVERKHAPVPDENEAAETERWMKMQRDYIRRRDAGATQ